MNRQFGGRFGDEAYAIEELTAELISAMLGSEFNLPVELLDNHANYVAEWIRVLKSDARALLTVASRAEDAANYLLAFSGRGTEPEAARAEDDEIELKEAA